MAVGAVAWQQKSKSSTGIRFYNTDFEKKLQSGDYFQTLNT
tara:strand:- start:1245 stop:1367 length:123 start_codon:yes stop_codon:yes gene_type:complete